MNKIFIIALSLLLSSCIATHTAITKRNLDVKTKMSETIFLSPVSKSKKVVYVNVRNTSGKSSLELDTRVKAALINKGYRITEEPSEASFILQANVLQAGKLTNKDELYKDLGDAIIPGILGGVIGAAADDNAGAAIGAIAGATIGLIGSAFIEDVTYSIITDIQISQKMNYSQNVSESALKKIFYSGDDGNNDPVDGWKKYTTRIISYANKVNLNYKQAEPLLTDELTRSIAGIL